MDRAKKEIQVSALRQTFESMPLVVVAHQKGLTVAEVTDLRSKMREAGAGYRVTKNRLARLALDGTPHAGLKDLFHGPTAICFSEDPVAAARVAFDFANRNDKLAIVGGGLGQQALDQKAVENLAKLPSLDELRGKLVGLIQSPAQKLAMVLSAPAGQVARVLGAYASKDAA
ncbi:MAG: 50S ribosomal protein L10 [Alphaproteobacteria bacterium]